MPLVSRTLFDWQLRTRTLPLGRRTVLLAILNLTPDSFSETEADRAGSALTRALTLLDAGADILDLGAESTRPNATPITPAEEQQRLLPTLRAILRARPDAILSVDTYHPETARQALLAGAEIINDVSGLTWEGAMGPTLSEFRSGIILGHTRGRPVEWHSQPALRSDMILPLVLDGLHATLSIAQKAGIPAKTIVLDPGFGFGKVGAENLRLLSQFDQLRKLLRPLVAGISRKGFLAAAATSALHLAVPPPPSERDHLTTAANTAAILAGAHILRVHDLRPAQDAAAIADSLLGAG